MSASLALNMAWLLVAAGQEILVAKYASEFLKSTAEIWRDERHHLRFVLNGDIMSSTSDEHIYHEMLVHSALLSAPRSQHILIVGGSEGATLREVLHHSSVQNVTMVDIDKGLVNFCNVHLHEMHRGSFTSEKVKMVYEDGAAFVRRHDPKSFDVVIVDGIDFIGQEGVTAGYGNTLFGEDFYHDVYKVLRPGGVLVQYMSDVDREEIMQKVGFNETVKFGVDIPSFHGEGARFVLAGKQVKEPLIERLSLQLSNGDLNYNFTYFSVETMRHGLSHTARRLKGAPAPAGGQGGEGGDGDMPPWVWAIIAGALGIVGLERLCKKKEEEEGKTRAVHLSGDEGEDEEEQSDVESEEEDEEEEGEDEDTPLPKKKQRKKGACC
eukprot:gnl/MRDRNA2_/MRDRNA2_82102_c1_seq1.p1 gnl/MRDRNA2_/MRDRNA2_82102_c1~~gnl/MRDRNA2_/MRDRNA2_82102_c1_seq1.p1  ORF type:complete len:422 (+),score=87.95 gnl/MRDRNA2_/MRDRNA2_82102_c1_seq1:129-1268(+)